MLNVAVIGLGAGHGHLHAYRALPDVQTLAIADLNPQRLAERATEFGVPQTYTDYNDLLAVPEIDAVSVCVPNFLHAPVVTAALNAGKHVLVEKPMATSVAEAEAMLKAARENNRTLAVSMNYRWGFGPESLYLKDRIRRGLLGTIYYVRAVALRRRTFVRGYKGDRSWFISKQNSGGGGLIDMGPHMTDLGMWFADDFTPVSVSGVARTAIMVDTDVDDLACGLVRLKSGATLSLEVTWASFTRPGLSVTVLGTHGGALLDMSAPPGQRLTLYGEDDTTLLESTPVELQSPEGSDRNVQEHFVRSLREGRVPENSGERGLAVMRVLEGIYQSSTNGCDVALPTADPLA